VGRLQYVFLLLAAAAAAGAVCAAALAFVARRLRRASGATPGARLGQQAAADAVRR
jgi:hypothetical protein